MNNFSKMMNELKWIHVIKIFNYFLIYLFIYLNYQY